MSYIGLRPASPRAADAARSSSKKQNTRCELLLRKALTALALRYRVDVVNLVGRPDIVFRAARIIVFCDGDYWHGRDLDRRLAKLATGHNAPYWVAKITANVERDRHVTATLERDGWLVLRYWEGDIKANADAVAHEVAAHVRTRRRLRG
ncbi:MAG: DNA mismatch endonuclease Vsr [Kofleriaceae bacterium]